MRIGVDLGGTNIRAALVDGQSIIRKVKAGCPAMGTCEEVIEVVAGLISKVLCEDVESIGIGVPSVVDTRRGIVYNVANIPSWQEVHLKDIFEKRFGVPVHINNDANCFSLGESRFGQGRGYKDVVGITLGTGVGSGIVINGEVVYGHDGFAGELGHTAAVHNNGRTCGCGKTGCLETYASATGVARTAREWLELTDEPSLLRGLETIASKDVYEAAKVGDKLALKIFEFTGKILGRSFADFIAFSAPEAIVLFGGLARAKEFLTAPIEDAMNANVLPLWRNKVKVVYSELKESDAAILGASALAWER